MAQRELYELKLLSQESRRMLFAARLACANPKLPNVVRNRIRSRLVLLKNRCSEVHRGLLSVSNLTQVQQTQIRRDLSGIRGHCREIERLIAGQRSEGTSRRSRPAFIRQQAGQPTESHEKPGAIGVPPGNGPSGSPTDSTKSPSAAEMPLARADVESGPDPSDEKRAEAEDVCEAVCKGVGEDSIQSDSASEEGIRLTEVEAGHCPICGTDERPETLFPCPRCGVKYHSECWEYFGGCAIYGCEEGGL